MASSTETGHAVNISNFKILHDQAAGHGATWNPSNDAIKTPQLLSLWTSANTAQTTVNGILAGSAVLINARHLDFEKLDGIVTRSFKALKSTEANSDFKKDAKSLADKIRGFRVKKPKVTVTPGEEVPPTEEWVSNSHQSYVQKADAFDQYVQLLASEPLYAPVESIINMADLNTFKGILLAHNENIGTNVIVPLEAARNARNNFLYKKDTGICDIAAKAKEYAGSVFGTKAAETKAIVKLKFVKFLKIS